MATFSDSNHQAKIKIQATKNDNNGLWRDGKSVLINTLVPCIRKIFKNNDTVFVKAPTGAAAYNVRGSTIHREFKINIRNVPGYNEMSDNTKKELMKKLLRTIASSLMKEV